MTAAAAGTAPEALLDYLRCLGAHPVDERFTTVRHMRRRRRRFGEEAIPLKLRHTDRVLSIRSTAVAARHARWKEQHEARADPPGVPSSRANGSNGRSPAPADATELCSCFLALSDCYCCYRSRCSRALGQGGQRVGGAAMPTHIQLTGAVAVATTAAQPWLHDLPAFKCLDRHLHLRSGSGAGPLETRALVHSGLTPGARALAGLERALTPSQRRRAPLAAPR